MLVNWSGKLAHMNSKFFRILILFLSSLAMLVVIYSNKSARIVKEQEKNRPLKHTATNLLSTGTNSRWIIVANPGDVGDQYVCSLARVGKDSAWKTIIIGDKVECCKMPDCYSIHSSQLLRMSYRTAATLKNLMENEENVSIYGESVRNLAFIWVIHRGAKHIFDAYVDEYIAAKVSIPRFEEEISRQLHTLALDESIALVEDKTRISRGAASMFRNPYQHFGRPDVTLVPGVSGSSGSYYNYNFQNHPQFPHRQIPTMPTTLGNNNSHFEFPAFRICEVRPPSIEKFLEIDEGWWDMRAPALVLPGDTMPPLCTRNTLFSPEAFWALPILANHDGQRESLRNGTSTSRIPPWYLRGLWSQSLLGDLGGSIRLTLARVPTLHTSQNYLSSDSEKPSSSILLKRWHCKSRSTFRCLLLMSKELSKSVHFRKNDLALIESWIVDLKSIHYAEPPMLPRRRSHGNPCLGADGLHGVSFFPALEPNTELDLEYQNAKRNDTLKLLLNPTKTKRWSEIPLSSDLKPAEETSTYLSTDWSAYKSEIMPSFKELEDSPSEDFVRTLVTHSRQKAALLEEKRSERNQKDIPITDPTPQYPEEREDFPILKAMADNMCPGFGPLIPFNPHKTYDDLLLIVAFTNQHYDLIPTLEVLYRSVFPNILYCGHPHVSVDLFLRKYQTAEKRSFSFLPTYTRATYECILGAMEMNYEVKGYVVVTDETLMKSWNLMDLQKSKIWFSSSATPSDSSSRHVPVTKQSWKNLDPGGQKLPRLLDGIVSTWKLFSYILSGHDSWIMDHNHSKGGIKRRSTDEELLKTEESSFVQNPELNSTNSFKGFEFFKSWNWSDPSPPSNETESSRMKGSEDSEIELGDEDENEDETSAPANEEVSAYDMIEGSSSSSTLTPPPLDEIMESDVNFTSTIPNSTTEGLMESTASTESGVGVPLYHVEHVEPPTPPTWHRPEDTSTTTSTPEISQSTTSSSSEIFYASSSTFKYGDEDQGRDQEETQNSGEIQDVPYYPSLFNNSSSPTNSSEIDAKLRKEMEILLDTVQDVYLNMLHIVTEYKEMLSPELSSEGPEPSPTSRSLLEDFRSHRISPREFRHIRCSSGDEQPELCGILRTFISTLGQNLGPDLELDYDNIPMYYLPSWATKPFYSVANVLLHFGVTDELALPLLFRGLALEGEWVSLRRSAALKVQEDEGVEIDPTHYYHPFNLHKVFSDMDKRKLFCSNYLLNVFQM